MLTDRNGVTIRTIVTFGAAAVIRPSEAGLFAPITSRVRVAGIWDIRGSRTGALARRDWLVDPGIRGGSRATR